MASQYGRRPIIAYLAELRGHAERVFSKLVLLRSAVGTEASKCGGVPVDAESRRTLDNRVGQRVQWCRDVDDLAAPITDRMIVPAHVGVIVSCAVLVPVDLLSQPVLDEQIERAVDGGEANLWLLFARGQENLLRSRMRGGITQYLQHNLPVTGHPKLVLRLLTH